MLPFSIGSQPFELLVRVEDERWPGKTARLSRAVRVHSDHIHCLPAETEGEMRIDRIGADGGIPIVPGGITVVEKAQLFPQEILEFLFVGLSRPLEDRDE